MKKRIIAAALILLMCLTTSCGINNDKPIGSDAINQSNGETEYNGFSNITPEEILIYIKTNDIYQLENYPNIDESKLANALHSSAKSLISENEAYNKGFVKDHFDIDDGILQIDTWNNEFYYKPQTIILDSVDEDEMLENECWQFYVYCNPESEVSAIYCKTKDKEKTLYSDCKELYNLLRYQKDIIEKIDKDGLKNYGNIINDYAALTFSKLKKDNADLKEYVLSCFEEDFNYKEKEGPTYKIYSFNYYMTTDDISKIHGVGGMYIDGDLNVRDPEMMSGQLIVKTNGIESFESRILSNDETILLNNKTQKIIEQIETKLE